MLPADIKQQWLLPETNFDDVRNIAVEHNIPPLLAELLVHRGHTTTQAVADFLAPAQLPLSSPFDLHGVTRAVERIELARAQEEHVRVIGDYDVDGIAGTALLVRALRRFGIHTVTYALPNRLTDGYGLNPQLVDDAHNEGVTLLVTVDNGISATDAADTAEAKGIDLIITDHHSLPPTLPQALAIINPKQGDAEHPFADACGTAVAYKLAEALNDKQDDLSLVALATIADIVPLHHENRTLVALGMSEIQQGYNFAVAALAKTSKQNLREMRAETIAFQIAPRINASGRIGTGTNALNLLLSDDLTEIDYLASCLEDTNKERRNIEAGIYEEAFAMSQEPPHSTSRVLVLASRNWHPGVIGIAAAKLMYKLAKPVFLVAIDDDGIGRSSGRSTPDFNLVQGLQTASDCLIKFGGHHAAAGFTIAEGDLDTLRAQMEKQAADQHIPEHPMRTVSLDGILSFTDITNDLLYALDRMEPYGKDNPTPVSATYGVELVPNSYRAMQEVHMRCTFKQAGRTFPAIGFNLADAMETASSTKKFDIGYTPGFNTYRGDTAIQLQIKEIIPR